MDWEAIAVLVIGIPLIAGVFLIVQVLLNKSRIRELSARVRSLEFELNRLKARPATEQAPTPAPSTAQAPVHAATQAAEAPVQAPPHAPIVVPQSTLANLRRTVEERRYEMPAAGAQPPPMPTHETAAVPPVLESAHVTAEPPPISEPPLVHAEASHPPPRKAAPAINWEQFMGVKLFAWIGGFALFLGVAFFIKYSFDNNLVSPELRVALGFAAGIGLLVGGVVLSRKQYLVMSQTLCATGTVILYAVTFACRSIYHFQFFGPVPTFLLMVLITATAFLLAVRLDALVVAILGMLGGFLTPVLLSTGQDNPTGLFGYIAILDAGLVMVALSRRWYFLNALAALGTAIMEIGWADKFFTAEKYFDGNKIWIALAVLFLFNALYLIAVAAAKRRGQANQWLSGSALGLGGVAIAFCAGFLTFPTLADRPWLIFGFVFVIDACITAVVLLDATMVVIQPLAGLGVFALLADWTSNSLTAGMLNAGLTFFFIFAVAHSAFPVWLKRTRGVKTTQWASQIFAPLALFLVLIPIFKLTEVSFIVWPFVLLVDVLAIVLAIFTMSLLPVVIVLLLTLAATGELIFKIPANLTGLPVPFFLLGAFAVFFVVVGVWLARKFVPKAAGHSVDEQNELVLPFNKDIAAQLPAFSAILPFLLLIMATLRLPLANPSPVFGLALLLVVLLLGVTKLFSLDWMPAIGLVSVAALECAWHFSRFEPANAKLPLAWYVLFFAVFAIFPFLFLRAFSNRVVPWATAAMVGLPQFFLIHRLVSAAYPNNVMGLLPAVFALPPLVSLVVVLKKVTVENPARMTQLAWFGGVALFFITLIFPIQFDRQWITLGWALEGAAVLWLFHRVPHPGLQMTGVGLLIAAFARLALNPAVLEYHPRSATPILNWYLYAYGIVTVCLFLGARLLAPPRNKVLGTNAPPILTGLGTLLAFLLLNIEIADFFSPPGSTLTFQFSGNFARDMTYSIAWALFALTLLVIGIVRKMPASRYTALGLLSVTLLKLFFHDLTQLNQLYRIGAFIMVAVIAMLASFAYQKFYAVSEKQTKNEAA